MSSTEQAIRQLDQAHDYITLSNSELVATRITMQIVSSVQSLVPSPCRAGLAGPGTRKLVPAQPVDATPLWSFDLAIRFKRTDPWGCSPLLPKQDAFSVLLCSRMILSRWNSWRWYFLLVLRRPIETTGHFG